MAWKPYQDQENRAYSGILTALFPEQTKTLPRILVWSLIFLLDLCLVAWGAFYSGLLQFDTYLNGAILFLVLLSIFWVQGWLWEKISGLWNAGKERKNETL